MGKKSSTIYINGGFFASAEHCVTKDRAAAVNCNKTINYSFFSLTDLVYCYRLKVEAISDT